MPNTVLDDFEWDEAKRLSTLKADTGLRPDFMFVIRMFDGPVLERRDGRKDYGEERWQALGEVDGRCFFIVFTWRGQRRRIISGRKASPKETREFRKATAAPGSD